MRTALKLPLGSNRRLLLQREIIVGIAFLYYKETLFTALPDFHCLLGFLLPSATKLPQGNFFSPVCHSVPGGCGGVCLSACWNTLPVADIPLGRHPLDRPPPPPGQTHTTPGQTPPRAETPRAGTPLGRHPTWAETPFHPSHPLPADGYCSRRCASYWNTFLLQCTN